MISKKEVERVAKLAYLDISEKEKNLYVEQLSEVLDYVGQLKEVDTKNVEPTAQVTGLENVYEGDIPRPSESSPNDLLAGTPEMQDGYVKVKAVL